MSPPVSLGFCLVKVVRGLLPFVVVRCSLSLVVGRGPLSFAVVETVTAELEVLVDAEQHEEQRNEQ